MALNPKEILLICLGHNSLEKKNKLLASLPGNEWQKVIDLAKEQFILPFLYYQIKNVQADIPAETLSQLRGLLMETAATNLSLYHGINSLLNSLHAKGIPVIVLKGGYLAEAVYENVGLRTMSDIDLLVKEADLPAVDNELISKGYRPKEFNRVIGPEHQHFGYTLPGRNLFVEVHWTIMPPVYKFIIDMPELWKRAVPVTLGAAPAFSLGLEDVILHLCLHTAKHAAEMGIRMLVDIDVLLKRYQEKVNWTFLVETAREWKAEHAVYLVLRLSRDMLDAAVPDPVIKDLKPKEDVENYFTIAQKELLSVHSGKFGNNDSLNFIQITGTSTFKRKQDVILYAIFPPVETIARHYPARINSWKIYFFYPVRFLDILGRAMVELFKWFCVEKGNKDHQRIVRVSELRDWLLSE